MSMLSFRIFVANKIDKDLYESELCNSNLNISFTVFDSAQKDPSTRGLLDHIFINLFSVKYSGIFYGHYHNAFERSRNSYIRHFFMRLAKKLRTTCPKVFDILYSVLESITLFRSPFKSRYFISPDCRCIDVYTTALLSTKELRQLRQSIKAGNKIAMVVRNWDNPSSKSYISKLFVSSITSWSKQMDKQLMLFDLPRSSFFRYTTPRFSYLQDLNVIDKSKPAITPKSKIYYVGSQKNIENEIYTLITLANLASAHSDFAPLVFVYRPHPWSPLPSLSLLQRLSQYQNIVLDQSVKHLLDEQYSVGKNIIDQCKELGDSLVMHLHECDLLISPAGTLCLEAGLMGKPVVVDLCDYSQVTIKLQSYFAHFSDYSSEYWVKRAFTCQQIFKAIEHFSEFSLNPSNIRASSLYYADIEHKSNLSAFLESIHACS